MDTGKIKPLRLKKPSQLIHFRIHGTGAYIHGVPILCGCLLSRFYSMPDFFQLERDGPVYQFDSAVQDTMKLFRMLIGNAVVDNHLFTSLEGLHNFFTLLSEVIWLAPSLSSISSDLKISNKSRSLTEVMIILPLTAKLYICVLLKGMSGSAKWLQKFIKFNGYCSSNKQA